MTPTDRSHLNILGILYYVFGGLGLAGTVLGGGAYAALGAVMAVNPEAFNDQNQSPDTIAFIGLMILIGAGVVIVLGVLVSTLYFFTGGGLRSQKRFTLCVITAALACLSVPLGTILGVFTFVVIFRPQVKAAFQGNADAGV